MRVIITGHWHNTQRLRTCEQRKRVDALVLFTSPTSSTASRLVRRVDPTRR